MSNSIYQNKIQSPEEILEELRKDFVKITLQFQDIQEAQKTYREIQEKKAKELFPFIDIRTSSTCHETGSHLFQ